MPIALAVRAKNLQRVLMQPAGRPTCCTPLHMPLALAVRAENSSTAARLQFETEEKVCHERNHLA